MLKILYAGEDEEMDIDGSGNLVIKAGGQEIVHKIQMPQIQGSDPDNGEG